MSEMINSVGHNIKEKIYTYLVTMATAINCDHRMTDFISGASVSNFSLLFGGLKIRLMHGKIGCCFKLVKTSFITTFVLFWNIYLFSFIFLNLNWNVVKLWDVILYFMKLVWILLFKEGMCCAALFCIEFFITKTIGQFLKPECVQRYNSENSSTQCVDVYDHTFFYVPFNYGLIFEVWKF